MTKPKGNWTQICCQKAPCNTPFKIFLRSKREASKTDLNKKLNSNEV